MELVQRTDEIHRNFMAFQSLVSDMLPDNEGQWAVIAQAKLVGIFPTIRAAADEAARTLKGREYSIQRVTDKPFDLGFLSYGAGPGIAV